MVATFPRSRNARTEFLDATVFAQDRMWVGWSCIQLDFVPHQTTTNPLKSEPALPYSDSIESRRVPASSQSRIANRPVQAVCQIQFDRELT